MTVISNLYKGSVSFGRIISIFWAILATIVCIVIFYLGIKQVQSIRKYTGNSKATILSKKCNKNIDNQDVNCSYDITYIDENNKKIDTKLSPMTNVEIVINTTVDIVYDVNDPTKVRLSDENNTKSGYLMMIVSVLIALCFWAWVWFTRSSEFVASATGVSGAINILK